MINNIFAWSIIGFLTGYLSMIVEANILRKEQINNYRNQKLLTDINFGKQYFLNPIFYTITTIFVFFLVSKLMPNTLQTYWFVGLIIGFLISTIKLINNYVFKVYNVSKKFLYVWNITLYVLFYLFIIKPLMKYLYMDCNIMNF